MAPTAVGYFINLPDQTQVAALQAQYPSGIQIPPSQAATLYGLTLASFDSAYGGLPPQLYNAPGYVTVPGWGGTIPDPPYASEVWEGGGAWGGGYPGSVIPIEFFWVGMFLLSSPADVTLGQRYWIDGFELPHFGEGATTQAAQIGRDASRTADGLGWAYRGTLTGIRRTHALAVTQATSSERLYVRLRAVPSGGEDSFWHCRGSIEGAGDSVILTVDPSGAVHAYNCGNAAYPGTLLGTVMTLAVGTWVKLDIYLHYSTGVTDPGCLVVYVNDVPAFTATVAAGGAGLGLSTQKHSTSSVGTSAFQVTPRGMEVDLDDWIGATATALATGLPSFVGTGIGLGSHVQGVRATGFGGSFNPAWVGGFRQATALPSPSTNIDTSVALTTSTNGAILDLATDFTPAQKGAAAVAAGVFGVSGADASAQVGSSALMTAAAINAGVWSSTLYSVPEGTLASAIPDLGVLTARVIRGTAGALSVRGPILAAEMIGVFGVEDAQGVAFPRFKGIHNQAYPSINQQNLWTPPPFTVSVEAGTYIGNAIDQDVFAQYPGHWFWVRNAVSTQVSVYYSSMLSSHNVLTEGENPGLVPQALLVGGTTPAYRISGSLADTNANGNTYQWVAISDPAMIYLLCGAFAHKSTVGSASNALVDPAFTPEGAFLCVEAYNSAVANHYFKGLGHGTNTASKLNAAVASNIATLSAGIIASLSAIHTDVPQTSFCAIRRTQGGYQTTLLDLVTWTGDGTGSRNITCHLGGHIPAFAVLTPHNGSSYMRDPSHTANNSLTIGGANVTTAITAFTADTVTVGALGNAAGIVYDLFVLRLGIETGVRSPGAGDPWSPAPVPPGGPSPAPPVYDPTHNTSGCLDTHSSPAVT